MRRLMISLFTTLLAGMLLSCERAPAPPAGTPITFQTNPPGATVLVDDEAWGETPLEGKRLPPGPHMLEFRLAGYERSWQPIPADHTTELNLDVELTPLTTAIYVTTEPEGAFVRLDGSDFGAAPLVLTSVSIGEHNLSFNMPGFAEKTLALSVESARPLRISESMNTVLGGLEIHGEPAGSLVALNGREYGELPMDEGRPLVIRGLTAGPYELSLSKPGYRAFNQRVTVKRNELTKVEVTPLAALPGEIRISSDPPQAVVTDMASNAVLGNTPLKLENLPDGLLEVRISKDGYDPQTSRVIVSHGLFKEIEVKLLVNSGDFSLITSPPGVEVHVDGKQVGVTTAADNPEVSAVFEIKGLLPGPHRLSLVHPLYERLERPFFVERGKTEHLGTLKLTKIWRPTHLLKLKNGRELKGILATRMADGSIVFERAPNIKVTYKADEIATLTSLTGGQ